MRNVGIVEGDEAEAAGLARELVAHHLEFEGKIHRVDPDFGSTLTVSNRDSQSNCWVNWKIMGQPCEFQVGEPGEDFAARRTSWLAAYRQALKRRAAASASVNDGIPAQPTPGAATAAAAASAAS